MSIAVIILVLIIVVYCIVIAVKKIDAVGDQVLGEEAAFITDLNAFLMILTVKIWIPFWLYKLIAVALFSADFDVFSELDFWLISIILFTWFGGHLSHSYSRVFGWISLVLILWPLAL